MTTMWQLKCHFSFFPQKTHGAPRSTKLRFTFIVSHKNELCVFFGYNKPIKLHFVPRQTFRKCDFSAILKAVLFESSETGEMLLMRVLSHPGNINSKCCIVTNWMCFTYNVVLFLSLKVPPVTKSLASPSSTTWCQTPSRTRHSWNLSTAFKPCMNVCVSFIRKWIKQLPGSVFMMMILVLIS